MIAGGIGATAGSGGNAIIAEDSEDSVVRSEPPMPMIRYPCMSCVTRLALVLLGAQASWAQYVVSARAGTIHYIDGQVSVDGQPLRKTPVKFPVLLNGQVLRTANGRAEVLLGSGVFLRLGDRGALRMLDNRLEDTQVELQRGIALVEVVDMPPGSDIHVLAGSARTGFKGIGLHRFDADSKQLRVFGGHAEIRAGDRWLEAGRGRLVQLEEPLSVSAFDPRRKDALLQWAARRSFFLYTSSLDARLRPTNWEVRTVNPATRGPEALRLPQSPQDAGVASAAIPSDQDVVYLSNRDFGVMIRTRARGQPSAGTTTLVPLPSQQLPTQPTGGTPPSPTPRLYPGSPR